MRRVASLLGVLCTLGASPALAQAITLEADYAGDVNGVAAGGQQRTATYVHTASLGLRGTISKGWSFTAKGAWTAGESLSAKAIGDVAGVQGPFNSGNGAWLYELKLSWESEAGAFHIGRLSSGDAFPSTNGMDQFVNSAFSSNGGAISVNDAGRATSPAGSWGTWAALTGNGYWVKAGAFLSDPRLFDIREHGTDFRFRADDGVLGFVEAALPLDGALFGLGAWGDTRPMTTFAGAPVKGTTGYYAWAEVTPADGWSGFLMAQAAPQDDRSLQTLFVLGGITTPSPFYARPDDSISLGFTSG